MRHNLLRLLIVVGVLCLCYILLVLYNSPPSAGFLRLETRDAHHIVVDGSSKTVTLLETRTYSKNIPNIAIYLRAKPIQINEDESVWESPLPLNSEQIIRLPSGIFRKSLLGGYRGKFTVVLCSDGIVTIINGHFDKRKIVGIFDRKYQLYAFDDKEKIVWRVTGTAKHSTVAPNSGIGLFMGFVANNESLALDLWLDASP